MDSVMDGTSTGSLRLIAPAKPIKRSQQEHAVNRGVGGKCGYFGEPRRRFSRFVPVPAIMASGEA
jgi:hypothetical protein